MMKCSSFIFIIFLCYTAFGIEKFKVDSFGLYTSIEDNLSFKDVLVQKFDWNYDKDRSLILENSSKTHWIKFRTKLPDIGNQMYLVIQYPLLDDVTLFITKRDSVIYRDEAGEVHNKRENSSNFISFVLPRSIDEECVFYLKIKSSERVLLPIQIVSQTEFENSKKSSLIFFWFYLGIIVVMFLYNLIIYFFVKDKSYIYYVLHTLFVGITQLTLLGFGKMYFWPDSSFLSLRGLNIFTALVSLFGLLFFNSFLSVKSQSKIIFKILVGFVWFYSVFFIVSFFIVDYRLYQILIPTQTLVANFIVVSTIYLIKKGKQEAKIYLIAWIALMGGIVVFALRDFGILETNNFSIYAMPLGSIIEIIVFSIALANRINIVEKEKKELIQGQNIILERKIEEKTIELQSAQAQIVQNEKMASLGQLTAGVAHEINNPVSFIKGSLNPLKRDVEDLMKVVGKFMELKDSNNKDDIIKEAIELAEILDLEYSIDEIKDLVKSIDEGATRTQEIVESLKTFSRHDEASIKEYDLNEGIKSTIQILKSKMNNISVIEEFGEIEMLECFGGKLNQVFMNLLSNSIDAVHSKYPKEGGEIKVGSKQDEEFIYLYFEDNGTGMSEAVKSKLFDPFFTTKDVGKGTGLGMSITIGIIEQHKGTIDIETEEGKGTKFTIKLPKKLKPTVSS